MARILLCFLRLLFLLLLFTAPNSSAAAQGDLSRYHDKNRLLLVFAPSPTDPRWRHQDVLLAKSRAQFADRELLRFDFFERGGRRGVGADLRARYHIRSGSFRILLIGKDGHAAYSGAMPMALRDLMGRIDRMPMRRDEMRRRATGVGR